MQKININLISANYKISPKEKYERSLKTLSVALGREEQSTDLTKRHPFDVSIATVPRGKSSAPYHAHSAQWEFYHVLSGQGMVRDADGLASIGPGDAFLFKPGEPHQITNDGEEDLIYYIVADNPFNETCHYPDSNKWGVEIPDYRLLHSTDIDYFDGEE